MPGTSGSGGRNALSPAVHQLRGTFQACRHEGYDTPEALPGRPEPPLPLEGVAAEEWERMIARLEASGALSRIEDMAIWQYCRAVDETEGLTDRQERVEASLQILESSLGDVEADDKMALLREIGRMTQLAASFDNKIRAGRESIRKWLVEFGQTPAARGRVKLPQKPKDSKLEQFRKAAR